MCFLILNSSLHGLKLMMIMEGLLSKKGKQNMNSRIYSLEWWFNGDPLFFFVGINNGLTLKLFSLLTYGWHQSKEFCCAKH
jgi:hypothetical protein